MGAYYNEFDPKAAAWLRELIKQGHIPAGDVDERSIEDIVPCDLAGYRQHHFFAGVGGWAYALRLAGWADDQPVWTGSCPCQPFSAAGKGAGFADERHLWPAWQHLIAQCRPPVVFGEQVASPDALEWIDLVQADMEGQNYAFGSADTCAAGVSAPHIRQRLYWVADSDLSNQDRRSPGREQPVRYQSGRDHQGMEHATSLRWQAWRPESVWRRAELRRGTDGIERPVEPGIEPLAHGVPYRMDQLRGYGNAIVPQQAAAFIGAYLEARAESDQVNQAA